MKNQAFHRRLRYSLNGIKIAFKNESSFRTQALFAWGALILLMVLRPEPLWWALIIVLIALVLAAEMINTALEFIIDRLHPEQHPIIGKAKDCAAGAVLLLSFASIVVAGVMCWDVWSKSGFPF
ncbi:diacylglycerol kinase [Bdellovibrio sp. HCB2-146]|uniref:diacylglycerol kinase n=1 Tax=Bdellovibrio sp. HCB2-146 TaxID=3394362 RepID=UPI0039BC9CCA